MTSESSDSKPPRPALTLAVGRSRSAARRLRDERFDDLHDQLLSGAPLSRNAQGDPVVTYQLRYIHTDALGSPVLETNTAGEEIAGTRTLYEPFGAPLTTPREGAPSYTGHQYGSSTGLSYAQQRYYDPQLGVFYSPDPMAVDTRSAINFNRYAYANNSPYAFTDPDGRAASAFVGLEIVLATAGADIAVPDPSDVAAPVKGVSYSAAIVGTAIGGSLVWAYNKAMNESTTPEGQTGESESEKQSGGSSGNTNPYDGPVDEPVIAVDGKGNGIPVKAGEQIAASPNGKFQQVLGADGQPTGTRLDAGGHPNQKDPKAQVPHAHVPGVVDDAGNLHLPVNY